MIAAIKYLLAVSLVIQCCNCSSTKDPTASESAAIKSTKRSTEQSKSKSDLFTSESKSTGEFDAKNLNPSSPRGLFPQSIYQEVLDNARLRAVSSLTGRLDSTGIFTPGSANSAILASPIASQSNFYKPLYAQHRQQQPVPQVSSNLVENRDQSVSSSTGRGTLQIGETAPGSSSAADGHQHQRQASTPGFYPGSHPFGSPFGFPPQAYPGGGQLQGPSGGGYGPGSSPYGNPYGGAQFALLAVPKSGPFQPSQVRHQSAAAYERQQTQQYGSIDPESNGGGAQHRVVMIPVPVGQGYGPYSGPGFSGGPQGQYGPQFAGPGGYGPQQAPPPFYGGGASPNQSPYGPGFYGGQAGPVPFAPQGYGRQEQAYGQTPAYPNYGRTEGQYGAGPYGPGGVPPGYGLVPSQNEPREQYAVPGRTYGGAEPSHINLGGGLYPPHRAAPSAASQVYYTPGPPAYGQVPGQGNQFTYPPLARLASGFRISPYTQLNPVPSPYLSNYYGDQSEGSASQPAPGETESAATNNQDSLIQRKSANDVRKAHQTALYLTASKFSKAPNFPLHRRNDDIEEKGLIEFTKDHVAEE